MQDSQYPGRLFRSETSYQDRPLYALFAHVVSIPFRILIPGGQSFENTKGVLIEFQTAHLVAFWVVHTLLVIAAITLALVFMSNTFKLNILTKAAFIALLLINDLTKSFFWTPHTQLFSLLLVVFALYSWKSFQKKLTRGFEFIWFGTVSCLIFFYPILVLALTIPLFVNWRRYSLPSVIALVPYFLYPTFLTLLGGTYRRTTTEDFNQFVWIFEDKALLLARENLVLFIQSFPLPHTFIVIFLSLILIWCHVRQGKTTVTDQKSMLTISMFFVSYFIFLYFMGLYAVRLTLPPLLGLLSLLLIAIAKTCPKVLSNAVAGFVLLSSLFGFFFGNMIS